MSTKTQLPEGFDETAVSSLVEECQKYLAPELPAEGDEELFYGDPNRRREPGDGPDRDTPDES